MGRISSRKHLTNILFRQIRRWSVPLVFAGFSIFVVNLTFASTAPSPTELETFLQHSELIPHSETVEGFQQIYYLFNDKKVFVTEDNLNHTNPVSNGRYITWLGSSPDTMPQVYLYDVMTNTTLQLSGLSTNTSPDLYTNHVVWQQWVNDRWQVMYYDGLQVNQISDGQGAFRPRIFDNRIVYVTYDMHDSDQPWHIVEYNTQSQENKTITTTNDATQAWPHFTGDGQFSTTYDLNYLSN